MTRRSSILWATAMTAAVAALPAGCTTGGGAKEVVATEPGTMKIVLRAPRGDPDAVIHVKGLSCPFCVSNIDRWVERVDGVAGVRTDLNTGQAAVWFKGGNPPSMHDLWKAVEAVGYQPTRIDAAGQAYEGPNQ